MRNVSNIKLTGSVVKIDDRTTPNGFQILTITVAGDAKSRDGTKNIPFYQQVDLLGDYANFMRNQLMIGTHVTVLGTLEQRRWEAPDGGKRSAIQITADSVVPLVSQFGTVTDKKGQERLTGGQNTATLIGNLTRDAELRYTPNGVAVANLSLAVNTRKGDKEVVSFYDVAVWNELAEQVAELKKGTPALIEGPISNETWTDKEGNTRYATRFEAFSLHAIRRPAGAGKAEDPSERQPSPQDLAPVADPLDEFPPESDLPF